MPARPTRRAVLGAALAAAACTPHRQRTTRADPDAALLAEARAQELTLVSTYDGLLTTVSAPLRPTIQRLRDAHAAHVVALGASAPPAPSASAVPTSPSGEPAAALAPVAAAEATAQRAHVARAQRAASGDTAALLASVAAAAGSYATTLRVVSAR